MCSGHCQPDDRVIIDPGSKTPLSLRIYEAHNYNTNSQLR